LESINNDAMNDESSSDEGMGRALKKKKSQIALVEKYKDFSPQFEIEFEELKFEEKLSEGGYGIVYKGIWKQTQVAIKQIKFEIV
jgi:serine/threonine protein kinase